MIDHLLFHGNNLRRNIILLLQKTYQADTYLIPAIVIPHKRQIICNFERTILVEKCQLTAATGTACQPNDNRIAAFPSGFKEEVEHPVNFCKIKFNNCFPIDLRRSCPFDIILFSHFKYTMT